MVLVAAVGSVGSRAADAFTIANQLPNNLYAIISTGLLTAVVVPQIVQAAAHADGGNATRVAGTRASRSLKRISAPARAVS